MRSWKDISYAAGLAVVFVASVFAGALAQAGEVRWVATELMPPRWAIWQPNQVMMDEENLKGGDLYPGESHEGRARVRRPRHV